MENFRRVKHSYGFSAPLSAAVRRNTHSLFLDFLTGLGAPGLLSLLWLAVVSSLVLDRVARPRLPRPLLPYVALGSSACLIADQVHGLVESPTRRYDTLLFLGILVGLSFGVVNVDASGEQRGGTMSGVAPVFETLF
jgi:O-antigen ligase